ncbi:MAG: type II toxin-antitoxin system RelE/ParE family toxin [Alphaproteobacteria bacterium]|nr:type II toxin-antitoxin system RelE/ParE family toxin [Alphaproteobacteria bacterium]
MAWKIDFDERAVEEIEDLDRPIQRRVVTYLENRVLAADDPRRLGNLLQGERSGLWRYRVGDYRVVCRVDQTNQTILVLRIGHRRNVYRR